MVLTELDHVSRSFTLKPVLREVTLHIGDREKIGVVGVNGSGKSTLLKICAGLEEPESGSVRRRQGMTVSYLPQMPDFRQARTAPQQVLADCHDSLGSVDEFEARAMLTRLGLTDMEGDVRTFSGGQKKRVALAAALIRPVDLLLLDEPTNHLDAQTIWQLEQILEGITGSLLMVTHDRYFLDRVCNRIAEIDQGGLFLHEGNYSVYLEERAGRMEMAAAAQRKRASILRRELEWIRRGAPARSTKQKARIARFEAMAAIRAPRQDRDLDLSHGSTRLGRTVIECRDTAMSAGGKTLFSQWECVLGRRERLGIVGPSGCGKTTLLRMLSGELPPRQGSVVIGETVKIGFFRQEFPGCPSDWRVIDYMRSIAEYVQTPEGRRSASQMLERFLFPPDVQLTPVSRLSGGEKRRLYLCGILMDAPNVLLLDEPTNDLDIETLEILEDALDEFPGAVVAVSHDRYFLDRIASRLMAFEEGKIVPYVCRFSEYLQALSLPETVPQDKEEKPRERKRDREERMTWREQQEYAGIDERMDRLSARLAELDRDISGAASDYVKLMELQQERERTCQELEEAQERWLYLQEKAERLAGEEN